MLPEFLFCENKTDLPSAGLILCTRPPHIIAQVLKCSSPAELQQYLQKHKPLAWASPQGYHILIYYLTRLSPHFDDTPPATTLEAMAHFYEQEKITPNLKYFKRYAITQ